MIRNNILLMLESFIIFSLHAAEDFHCTQEETPQCKICYKKIKENKSMTFEHSIITQFSEPATAYHTDELVLVNLSENIWKLALITDSPSQENTKTIHECKDHKSHIIETSLIRSLRLLWQYSWQPWLPATTILDSCKLFVERYKRRSAAPFAYGKIINRSQKIIIIGDIHGSRKSLLSNLLRLYSKGIFDESGYLDPHYYLVFTGDYTDRSEHGGEVWHMLATLKIKNPEQVFILKGNHETMELAKSKDFYKDWTAITQTMSSAARENLLYNLFTSLPHAALFGAEPQGKNPLDPYHFLICCHGGIDDQISFNGTMIDTIKAHETELPYKLISNNISFNLQEDSGLLWSDFMANKTNTMAPSTIPSRRGGLTRSYNYAATAQYMEDQSHRNPEGSHIVDAIIRGHQHIPGGIVKLAKTQVASEDWLPLESEKTVPVEPKSVYTCTSSPEALGPWGCYEDSFAVIEWSDADKQWTITPYIQKRIPKRWLHLVL